MASSSVSGREEKLPRARGQLLSLKEPERVTRGKGQPARKRCTPRAPWRARHPRHPRHPANRARGHVETRLEADRSSPKRPVHGGRESGCPCLPPHPCASLFFNHRCFKSQRCSTSRGCLPQCFCLEQATFQMLPGCTDSKLWPQGKIR